MSAERKPRAPASATAGIRSNPSGGLPNGPLRTRGSRAIYPARQGSPQASARNRQSARVLPRRSLPLPQRNLHR